MRITLLFTSQYLHFLPGAIRSLVTLLEMGADPRTTSLSDGATALTLAMTPDARSMQDSASIIHVLETHPLISQHQGSFTNYGYPDQNGSFQHTTHSRYENHNQGHIQYESPPSAFNPNSIETPHHHHHPSDPPVQQVSSIKAEGPLLPSTLSQQFHPDFLLSDDFRMFGFKVTRCPKRQSHDWRSCPYAHPTENARRRDPRQVLYCAIPCPDYKQGFCVHGESCHYSHGVYESWLHPSKYRTQLCKDGPGCHRPICFFAHQIQELRAPTFTWMPPEFSGSHEGSGGLSLGGGGGGMAHPSFSGSMAENRTSLGAQQRSIQVTNPSFTPHTPHQPGSSFQSGLATPVGDLDLLHGPQASSRGSSIVSNTNRTSMRHTPPGIHLTHPGMALIINPDDTDLFPPLPDIHDAAASPHAAAAALAASSTGIPWGSSGVLHNMTRASNAVPPPISSSSNILVSSTSGLGVMVGMNGSPPQSSIDSSEHAVMMLSAVGGAGGGGLLMGGDHMQGVIGSLAPPSHHHARGGGGGGGANAGLLAPRMSNAFARRHGLNPRDHGLVNLQKLAMQEAAALGVQSVGGGGGGGAAIAPSPPHQLQVHQVDGLGDQGQAMGFQSFQKTPGRPRATTVNRGGGVKGRGGRPDTLPLTDLVTNIQPLGPLPPLGLAFTPPASQIPSRSNSSIQIQIQPPPHLGAIHDLYQSHVIPTFFTPDPDEYLDADPLALETPIGVSVVSATVLKALDADEDEDEEREATTLGVSLASVLSIGNTQNHSPGKPAGVNNLSLRHVSAVI